ncbi:DNA-binding transcriptional MerR regulator [Kitasatospora sp. MAP12-15]|uniref:MerR family transcriptional regulator n=1 Tax=unclassified Kitasatospora TaxID=2633591 RepID=UPI002473948E|nr:MerR family transcriptional regulator [Kitasatospora sp. MAP12-44]MDH6111286.1 DNA-binding transcriptional MerR regulator [Kitasatospora sp. MAP12-44]
MRVGELSNRAGVPVPTIKYYLREGLLPPGELTCPNQAQYGERHLHRLKLIRALLETGRLSIAAARDVLAAIDAPEVSLHETLGVVQRAITPPPGDCEGPQWQRAVAEASAWLRGRGWLVEPDGPAGTALAHLLLTLNELGQSGLLAMLNDYAAAAERLAALELAAIGSTSPSHPRSPGHPTRPVSVDRLVEGAVLGTVLGDALLATMHRLAREDASRRAFETL